MSRRCSRLTCTGPEALAGLFVPRITWSADFFTTLVAILGTTISPYLFFWQASQEAEDVKTSRQRKPLVRAPRQARNAFERIRADTLIGMAFSNLIAIAIIFTTAATLHQAGITNVQTSAQAAEALQARGRRVCLHPVRTWDRRDRPSGHSGPRRFRGLRHRGGLQMADRTVAAAEQSGGFYATLAAAAVLGVAITLSPIDPIKALYWTAVINGVVAVPVMTVMMLMTAQPRIMGKFTISGWLRALGWASTLAMAACVIGMVIGWFG